MPHLRAGTGAYLGEGGDTRGEGDVTEEGTDSTTAVAG